MPVRLSEQEPRQVAVDRSNERDARRDETLRLAQRPQARDESFETEVRRVRDVRGPVSGALVVPVVRVPRREVDLRIAIGRSWKPVELIIRWARAKSAEDHRRRCRTAPRFAAAVVLGELA